jgi:TPP-dependent pyruvate/acetoin dehydrogenase alpha subunit
MNHDLTDAEQQDITAEVQATIERGVAEAEASPPPDPAEVVEGVYAVSSDA